MDKGIKDESEGSNKEKKKFYINWKKPSSIVIQHLISFQELGIFQLSLLLINIPIYDANNLIM